MQRSLLLGMRWSLELMRSTSTMTKLRIIGAELEKQSNDCVRIEYSKGVSEDAHRIHVPLVWLRDHSRDSSSYNWNTNQRRCDLTGIFERSQLANTKDAVRYDTDECVLRIRWHDGVKSVYTADDLMTWVVANNDSKANELLELWDQSTLKRLPNIPLSNFTLEAFVTSFVRYGVVSVSGVDACNPQPTRDLCERIAPIHSTFYGDFWIFGSQGNSQQENHEDTAYGAEAIGPHTDGTYFEQTPGIQVFHCLRPANKGGDTILVDGFAVADKLRRQNPGYYELLASTPVEHHYIEGGDCPSNAKIYSRSVDQPVIVLDRQANIKQIRFNPYDRAPFAIHSTKDIVFFYKAYECFSKIAHDPSNELRVSLKPGTVVFLDNFRILHARTAFQGERRMCGCYLSRDNFLALTRHLLPEN